MTYQADRPFTIYFVRHGITEPNFRGFRCGGDLDLPMMDIGCDQAYLLAKQIEKMNLRIGVIVSPVVAGFVAYWFMSAYRRSGASQFTKVPLVYFRHPRRAPQPRARG